MFATTIVCEDIGGFLRRKVKRYKTRGTRKTVKDNE